MLGSVQAKLNPLAAYQSKAAPSASTTASQFDSLMAGANAPESASATGVKISDSAAAAARMDKFDTMYSNVTHTQADYEAYMIQAGKDVSTMQGLPEGQFDFTNMSQKQLYAVTSYLAFTGKIGLDDTQGFPLPDIDSTNIDMPQNLLAKTQQNASYYSAGGFDKAAFWSSRASDIFQQLQNGVSTLQLSPLPDWTQVGKDQSSPDTAGKS